MKTQWNVNSLRTENIDGKQDVISWVQFAITCSDDEQIAQAQGNVELTYDANAPFIAYFDLTENQVIEWAKSVLTEDEIKFYETTAQNRLTNISTGDTKPLPWAI
jgi:hypothetical protein